MKKRVYIFTLLIFFIIHAYSGEPDTTVESRIITWTLADNYRTQKITQMDTTIDHFQIYNPIYKNCYSNTYVGNMGTAYQPNLYFMREKVSEFVFISPYSNYINIPEKQMYYNTTTPFTGIMYTTSSGSKEQSEESISILHTQNVSRYLNVGLSYYRIRSRGLYFNQNSKNSSFSLFSNYTQKRYFFHFNGNINSIKNQHNGGLDDIDQFMTKTDEEPNSFAMKLSAASTNIKNKSIFLAHGYTFDLIKSKTQVDTNIIEETKLQGTILHTFKFDMYGKFYKDIHTPPQDDDDTIGDWFYYTPFNPMYNPETLDSVYYRTVNNYIQYDMEPGKSSWINSGLRVGIGNEIERYVSFYLDTITRIEGHSLETMNNYIASELYNTSGENWKWNIYGKYYFTGYKTNNITLKGMIGKKLHFGNDSADIQMQWTNTSLKPNYFYQHFYSNHLVWNNDFLNINESRFSGKIDLLSRKISLEANYSLIDNYMYLDRVDSILTSQYGNPLSILALSLEKTFTFWKFTLLNKITYQVVDNSDILSLPELSVFNSTYFRQNIVKNVLDAQAGFDVYYHTRYYADDFMASFGSFINQKEGKVGNYPFIDVYISAKLKKVRFFLMFTHVNAGMLDRNYFTSYSYPMNYRIFKFGISTLFYN